MGIKEFFAKLMGKEEQPQAPMAQPSADMNMAKPAAPVPQPQATPAPVAGGSPQSIEDVEKMPEPQAPNSPEMTNGEKKQ